MDYLISLFLIIILAVVIFVLLTSRKKTSVPTTPYSTIKRSTPPPLDAERASSPPQPSEATRFRIPEDFYPVIPQIVYAPLKEGIYPTTIENVDPTIRKTLDKKIAGLKPLPIASLKLYNLLRSPHSSTKEVTAIIKTNPFLSARILRVINSAFYNLSAEITSVGRAIMLLGYNNVRALVFQDTLRSTLTSDEQGGQVGSSELWVHSTVVSTCAHYLSMNVIRSHEHDVATIGVLHDIGKYFFPLLERAGEPTGDLPTIIQEEKQYGINHALIGSLLVKQWQLSDIFFNAIALHHYPLFYPPESIPEPFLKPTFIVCLADLICNLRGYTSRGGELLPIRKEYFELFGLNSDLQRIVTQPLIKEIEKARATVETFITTQ